MAVEGQVGPAQGTATVRSRPLTNATYLAAANLGAKGFSFLFVLYANRALGKGLIGDYYSVLAFVGMFGIATDLGLGALAIRDVAQNRTLANRYVGNLLAIRTTISAACIALIVFLAHLLIAPSLRSAVYIYALALLPLAVTNTLQLVFQFSERMAYSAVLGVATSAVMAGMNVLVLFLGHHVLALVLVFTTVTMASTTVMGWLVYTRFLPLRLELDLTWWPALLRGGWPFAIMLLINILYNYADRQILYVLSNCGHATVCSPVGEYATAYRPLDILTMLFVGSINAAVMPAFMRVGAQGRADLVRLARSSAALALAFGVPIAIFGTFYAPEALHIVGGKSFIVAAPALSILIWTFPLVLLLSMLYNALYAIHLHKVVTSAFAVTLVFNVTLNLLLIPRYSYMASAALTVASEVLNGIVVVVALRRSLGPLGLGPTTLKMGFIAAAMVLVLWLLHGYRYSIFTGLPAGALVAVIGLRLTHFFGSTEREILGRLPLVGRYAGLL